MMVDRNQIPGLIHNNTNKPHIAAFVGLVPWFFGIGFLDDYKHALFGIQIIMQEHMTSARVCFFFFTTCVVDTSEYGATL